jgi:hypothetical protein
MRDRRMAKQDTQGRRGTGNDFPRWVYCERPCPPPRTFLPSSAETDLQGMPNLRNDSHKPRIPGLDFRRVQTRRRDRAVRGVLQGP